MTTRFDLEQQILEVWKVTNDIAMLVDQNADATSYNALIIMYEHRFEQLWKTFETLVTNREFDENQPIPEHTRASFKLAVAGICDEVAEDYKKCSKNAVDYNEKEIYTEGAVAAQRIQLMVNRLG